MRAFCYPTATNKVINVICLSTHTLSHAVRVSLCGHKCSAEMAAGQTTCDLDLGGSRPRRGTGAMCAPVRDAWIPC